MRRFFLLLFVTGCSSAVDTLPAAHPDAAPAAPDAGFGEADASSAPDAAEISADAGPPTFSGAATVSWTLQSEGTGTSYVEALLVDRNDEGVIYGGFSGILRAGPFELQAEDRPLAGGYLLRVAESGEVISLRRVIEGRLANASISELSNGDILLMGSVEAAVLGPDDPQPIVMPAQGDWTMVLARVARDGAVRWARRARGNVSQISASAGLEGRILIYGAFYETVELEAPVGTLVLSAENEAQYPGHGFWAELDEEGRAIRGKVVQGTAGSSINKMITESDGTIFFSGAFGFYPRGSTAIFGRGEYVEVTLASVSSDDDPAFDTFLGSYAPNGNLNWANMIRAYGWEQSGSDLVVIDGKPTIAVGVAGYPIGFADGTPDAVQIETDGALARYQPYGQLEWARSAPRFQRIFQAGGALHTASGVYDVWAAEDLRIEVEPEPGAHHVVLARFDTRGNARAASLLRLSNDPNNGAPRMGNLAIGGAGRSWLIAGDPSEEILVNGRRISPPSVHQRLVLVRALAP